MKIFLLVLMSVVFFAGCAEKDIETQRQECQDQGKTFTANKVFNHRNGEYEVRTECN